MLFFSRHIPDTYIDVCYVVCSTVFRRVVQVRILAFFFLLLLLLRCSGTGVNKLFSLSHLLGSLGSLGSLGPLGMCDEKKKLFLSFSSPVTLACHAMPCNSVPFNRLRMRGRANWVWYLLACSLSCPTARVTTFAFLLSIMHVLGGGVFLLMYGALVRSCTVRTVQFGMLLVLYWIVSASFHSSVTTTVLYFVCACKITSYYRVILSCRMTNLAT